MSENTAPVDTAPAGETESDGWPEPDYSDVPTVYLEDRKREDAEKKKKWLEEKKAKAEPSPAKAPEKPKPETPTQAEAKRKLKIKGKELEVDETQYHEFAQKGAAATQTWQEAANLKKETEARLAKIKNDPISVLREVGIDVDKLAEDYVWEQIQKKANPEEYARIEQQREFDRLKNLEKSVEEEKMTAKKKEAHQYYAQEFDKKIASAITQAKLPRNPRAANRVVDYLEAAIEQGYEPDISEIAANVREDLVKETADLLSEADEDALFELLGPKVIEKIRLALLKKFKASQAPTFNAPSREAPKPSRTSAQPKKVANDNWRDNLIKDYIGRR